MVTRVLFKLFITFATVVLTVAMGKNALALTPRSVLEPVVLRGAKLPALLGVSADRLALLTVRRAKIETIPFQIDQKDGNRRFYLSSQPHPLGPSDELVWMASDMGERAAPDLLKKTAPDGVWHEIRLAEKDETDAAYLYLLMIDNPPKYSGGDYVTYTYNDDLLRTRYYYSGFRNVIVADRCGWITSDGAPGPNVLTNVSVRFQARALLGLLPVDVTEKNLKSRIVGYKDGAIRLIKRIESAPQLGLGFRGPSNLTEGVFYRNLMQTIVKIHFPVGSGAVLNKANFQINLDAAVLDNPIDLHLPNDRVFTLKPDLPAGPYVLQTEPPRWIHFSTPQVDHAFAAVIDIPNDKNSVWTPDQLLYDQKNDGRTLGTLNFKVHIKPRGGDHFFYLYLFAPAPRSHRNAASVQEEMREIEHAMTMLHHNQAAEHPWLTASLIDKSAL